LTYTQANAPDVPPTLRWRTLTRRLWHDCTLVRRADRKNKRHYQRLLVGENSWGSAGAYAWYAEELPPYLREWPQVLFGIDDQRVVPISVSFPGGRVRRYFRIPGRIGEYVSITVLGFAHLD